MLLYSGSHVDSEMKRLDASCVTPNCEVLTFSCSCGLMKNEKRKETAIDWIDQSLQVYISLEGLDRFSVRTMAAIENGARYIIRNVKGKTVLDLNELDGKNSKSLPTPLAPRHHLTVLSI